MNKIYTSPLNSSRSVFRVLADASSHGDSAAAPRRANEVAIGEGKAVYHRTNSLSRRRRNVLL